MVKYLENDLNFVEKLEKALQINHWEKIEDREWSEDKDKWLNKGYHYQKDIYSKFMYSIKILNKDSIKILFYKRPPRLEHEYFRKEIPVEDIERINFNRKGISEIIFKNGSCVKCP